MANEFQRLKDYVADNRTLLDDNVTLGLLSKDIKDMAINDQRDSFLNGLNGTSITFREGADPFTIAEEFLGPSPDPSTDKEAYDEYMENMTTNHTGRVTAESKPNLLSLLDNPNPNALMGLIAPLFADVRQQLIDESSDYDEVIITELPSFYTVTTESEMTGILTLRYFKRDNP